MTYYVHDNGARPFRVVVDNHRATIYKSHIDKNDPQYFEVSPTRWARSMTVPVLEFRWERAYIARDRPHGNSILFHLGGNRYRSVGWNVIDFQAGTVSTYRSPVGNNDVPYPYAVDEKWVYLLIEGVRVDRNGWESYRESQRDSTYGDPYTYYYSHRRTGKPFRYKTVIKRLS